MSFRARRKGKEDSSWIIVLPSPNNYPNYVAGLKWIGTLVARLCKSGRTGLLANKTLTKGIFRLVLSLT